MESASTTADRRRRRLRIAVIAGGLALLLLTGVGVYGLLRGPGALHPGATGPAPASSSSAAASPGTSESAALEPIATTGRPETFARTVAQALFSWDTTAGYEPSDYAQVLADVAADDEAQALAADVRAYLPTGEAWERLRPYATRQWLTIDALTIPESWETAVAQAAPGQIPVGTVAYTITGTRHRAGITGTTPVETKRPVSFTVFLTCTPAATSRGVTGSTCALLRLSQPDRPLH